MFTAEWSHSIYWMENLQCTFGQHMDIQSNSLKKLPPFHVKNIFLAQKWRNGKVFKIPEGNLQFFLLMLLLLNTHTYISRNLFALSSEKEANQRLTNNSVVFITPIYNKLYGLEEQFISMCKFHQSCIGFRFSTHLNLLMLIETTT